MKTEIKSMECNEGERINPSKWVCAGKGHKECESFEKFVKDLRLKYSIIKNGVSRQVAIERYKKILAVFTVDEVSDSQLPFQRSTLLRKIKRLEITGIREILEKAYGKNIETEYLDSIKQG